MKKNSKKNANSIKNFKEQKTSDTENIQMENIPQKSKRQIILDRILVVLIVLLAVLLFYKLIDHFTGWGDAEKVIKRKMDVADRHAIYRRFNVAIKIYEDILKRWGNNPEYGDYIKQVKLNLAKTFKEANENEKAVQYFKELIDIYKDSSRDMYAWILIELGDVYNNMYNIQDALKCYQIILDEFKNTDWEAEAVFGMAESYKISGKNDLAIKYYYQIADKYKAGFLGADALTNIGQIYEKQGKEKEALKVYQRILNEFPEIVTEYARLRYNSLNEKMKNK